MTIQPHTTLVAPATPIKQIATAGRPRKIQIRAVCTVNTSVKAPVAAATNPAAFAIGVGWIAARSSSLPLVGASVTVREDTRAESRHGGVIVGSVGVLHHESLDRDVALSADQVVGRSDGADVIVDDARASAQHARIRWTGQGWEIRDLGSRNGTWVNGERIEAGPGCPLGLEAQVAFGGQEDPWTLVNDEPPCAFLQPLDGGRPRLANGDVLAPGPDVSPRAMIHRGHDGIWFIDDGNDEPRPLRDRQVLTLGERRFVFRTAGTTDETHENETAPPRIAETALKFSVSKDEEHVAITIVSSRGLIDVPPRRNAYVLLVLARHRLEDRERGGIPEADEGWVYTNDLVDQLGYETEQRLNLDIFRIREHFSKVGVEDAHDIVERRRPTGQLRIGVKELHIESNSLR